MNSHRFTRVCALFAGGAAIVAMGTLTACSKSSEEAPATNNPSTSSPSATPTEKSVNGGNKSFSPTPKPALPPTGNSSG